MIKISLNKTEQDFYAPGLKVCRGHLVIGSSVRLSVILSRLQTKCNISSFGDDTITKLGL